MSTYQTPIAPAPIQRANFAEVAQSNPSPKLNPPAHQSDTAKAKPRSQEPDEAAQFGQALMRKRNNQKENPSSSERDQAPKEDSGASAVTVPVPNQAKGSAQPAPPATDADRRASSPVNTPQGKNLTSNETTDPAEIEAEGALLPTDLPADQTRVFPSAALAADANSQGLGGTARGDSLNSNETTDPTELPAQGALPPTAPPADQTQVLPRAARATDVNSQGLGSTPLGNNLTSNETTGQAEPEVPAVLPSVQTKPLAGTALAADANSQVLGKPPLGNNLTSSESTGQAGSEVPAVLPAIQLKPLAGTAPATGADSRSLGATSQSPKADQPASALLPTNKTAGGTPTVATQKLEIGSAKEADQLEGLQKKRAASEAKLSSPDADQTVSEEQSIASTTAPVQSQAKVITGTSPVVGLDDKASGNAIDPLRKQSSSKLNDNSINNDETTRADDAVKTVIVDQLGSNIAKEADRMEPLLSSHMNHSMGSQGQFEIVLPNNQKISVQYAVAPEATQILMQASSRELARSLQANTAAIAERMTKRTGRRIDVYAA